MGKPTHVTNKKTSAKEDQLSANSKSSRGVKKKRNRDNIKYKNFIGNKKEGQGFADRRKNKHLYEYRKTMRKEQQRLSHGSEHTHKIYTEEAAREKEISQKIKVKQKTKTPTPQKTSSFHKAEMTWQQKQQEKAKKQQEIEKAQKERDEALAQYQQKKKAKHKKLCVKNYKGQPNMASQMDLLLEKIQEQEGSS